MVLLDDYWCLRGKIYLDNVVNVPEVFSCDVLNETAMKECLPEEMFSLPIYTGRTCYLICQKRSCNNSKELDPAFLQGPAFSSLSDIAPSGVFF